MGRLPGSTPREPQSGSGLLPVPVHDQQDCPLTFCLAGQGLADHTCVILFVCRPPIHKEGRVGGPGVKHNPKLGVTPGSGGRGRHTAQPNPATLPPLLRVWERTLVCVGRRTVVASTRMRMSVVTPEATAAPSRAALTLSFQVSLMGGAGLALWEWAAVGRLYHAGAQHTLAVLMGRAEDHASGAQGVASIGGAWSGDKASLRHSTDGPGEPLYCHSRKKQGSPHCPALLLPSPHTRETEPRTAGQLQTQLGGPGLQMSGPPNPPCGPSPGRALSQA